MTGKNQMVNLKRKTFLVKKTKHVGILTPQKDTILAVNRQKLPNFHLFLKIIVKFPKLESKLRILG